MAAHRLAIVSRTQGVNAPLKDGSVTAAGFDLDFEEVEPLVAGFRRMIREGAYDVCEMAVTSYLCAREHGAPLTALPIFLVRGFHHGAMYRAADGDVEGPADLAGRRVGVNRGYTVTTGVWARSILADEHGLDLSKVTWARQTDEHVATYAPPANVETLPGGTDLETAVLAGDLDAVVGAAPSSPGLVPLVEDADTAALASLDRRGWYPINHLVVVRDDVLASRPDVAPALLEAFAQAKQVHLAQLRAGGSAAPTAADDLHRTVMAHGHDDPLPYGLDANRAALETLIDHATAQGILTRRPDLEALFAPGAYEVG